MAINTRKSVCMCIGPMHNVSCLPISLSNDVEFLWVNEVRYIGAFIVRARLFKCSLDNAKNHFIVQPMRSLGRYRSCIASEEVTLQLIRNKCLPVHTL